VRKLDLQKAANKELAELPAKQYRQVVGAILELLQQPFPHYAKVLQGSKFWRIAVGEYRVVYRVDDETIYVVAFGKRNDSAVYKSLQRKH
jgi:mRNA interferase RelE/StbE